MSVFNCTEKKTTTEQSRISLKHEVPRAISQSPTLISLCTLLFLSSFAFFFSRGQRKNKKWEKRGAGGKSGKVVTTSSGQGFEGFKREGRRGGGGERKPDLCKDSSSSLPPPPPRPLASSCVGFSGKGRRGKKRETDRDVQRRRCCLPLFVGGEGGVRENMAEEGAGGGGRREREREKAT